MDFESFRGVEQKRTSEQEAGELGENIKNLAVKAEQKLPSLGERLRKKFTEKEYVLMSALGTAGLVVMGELINQTVNPGRGISLEMAGYSTATMLAITTGIKTLEALMEKIGRQP